MKNINSNSKEEETAIEELQKIIPDYLSYMEEENTFSDVYNDVQYEIGLYEDKIDDSLITKGTYKLIINWIAKYDYLIKEDY